MRASSLGGVIVVFFHLRASRVDIFSFIRCNFHKHTAVLAKINFWFYTVVDRFRKVLTFKAKISFGFYFVTELHGL